MTKISTTLDWIVLIFCKYIKYLADELRRKSKANMNESEILLDIENFHPPGGLPSLCEYRYNKRKMPRYGWHHTGACRPKSRNKGRHKYYTLSCRKKKGQNLK